MVTKTARTRQPTREMQRRCRRKRRAKMVRRLLYAAAVLLVAVAVLTAYIPMLTDAGGNAGSQSTSTIIRGMAVGDIEPHDLPKILWREFRIAILCGGTLALCNFAKLIVFDRIAAPVAAVRSSLVADSISISICFPVAVSTT